MGRLNTMGGYYGNALRCVNLFHKETTELAQLFWGRSRSNFDGRKAQEKHWVAVEMARLGGHDRRGSCRRRLRFQRPGTNQPAED